MPTDRFCKSVFAELKSSLANPRFLAFKPFRLPSSCPSINMVGWKEEAEMLIGKLDLC